MPYSNCNNTEHSITCYVSLKCNTTRANVQSHRCSSVRMYFGTAGLSAKCQRRSLGFILPGPRTSTTKLCASPSRGDISQDRWKCLLPRGFSWLSSQTLSRHFIKSNRFQPHGGTRRKMRRSSVSVGFILWEPRMAAHDFTTVHPIVVDMIQSDWWWIDQLVERHCHPYRMAMALAWRNITHYIFDGSSKCYRKTHTASTTSTNSQLFYYALCAYWVLLKTATL